MKFFNLNFLVNQFLANPPLFQWFLLILTLVVECKKVSKEREHEYEIGYEIFVDFIS